MSIPTSSLIPTSSVVPIQQPQNTTTKDLWDLAFQKLSVDEKTALSHFKPESKLEVLQHL